MEQNPVAEQLPVIGQVRGHDIISFEAVKYTNGHRHVYAVDKDGSKHHTSMANVLAISGFEDRSAYDENASNLYAGQESTAVVTPTASVSGRRTKIVPAPNHTGETSTAPATPVEAIIVGTTAMHNTVSAPAVTGKQSLFSRIKSRIQNWAETKSHDFYRSHRKSLRTAIAGLALVGGGAWAVIHGEQAGYDNGPQLPSAVSTNLGGHNGSDRTVLAGVQLPKDGSGSTTTTTPEQNADPMQGAIMANLSKIGLQSGEYNEVTNPDATFPGNSVEADQYSMDHGPQAWGNNHVAYTINGAKQLSEDILTGTGTFTASDASVAQQALKYFNVPDSVINQLKSGDYSNLELRVFTLAPNVTEVTYHNMTWNNNGTFAHEDTRIVNPANQDAIAQLAYKDANGNIQVVNFRIDCGGTNVQSFGSLTVEVPTPPATTVAPTPTTVKPTTTTTIEKPTTTTTKPGSTTTTTVPGSTTTTTPTTVPPTTTTTRPIPPKTDPDTSSTTVGAPPEGPTPSTPTTSIAPTPTTESTVPAVTTVPATSVPASSGGGTND